MPPKEKEALDGFSRCPIRVWLGIVGLIALTICSGVLMNLHAYAVEQAVLASRVDRIEKIAEDVTTIKTMLLQERRERNGK